MRVLGTAVAIALAACGVKAPPRPPLAATAEPAAPAADGGRPLGEHCLAPECAETPGGADGGVGPDGGRP